MLLSTERLRASRSPSGLRPVLFLPIRTGHKHFAQCYAKSGCMRQEFGFGEMRACSGNVSQCARPAIARSFPLPPLHHLHPQPSSLCSFLIDTPAIRITLSLLTCSAGARSNRHSLGPLFDVNSTRVGRSSADILFVSRAHGKQCAEISCYNGCWSWPATHVTLRKPIEPTLDPRVPSSSCPCARPRRILGWGKPKSRRMAPDLTRGVQGLAAHGEVDRSSKFSSRRAPLANCVIP